MIIALSDKAALRQRDGRFAATAAGKGLPDDVAAVICAGYFASVCRMTGIDRDRALRQLNKPFFPGLNLDMAYRRAAYARQLAMYLTATEADVPQAQIARICGLADAGVHKALRSVEDLRDGNPDYEDLITCVLVDVAMNDARDARIGRARRAARRLRKVTP